MGYALKILIPGIVLMSLYFGFLFINKDNRPNDMSGLVYLLPIILIVFLTAGGYFFGYIQYLRNPDLSLTLKMIEGFIGIIVLAGFLYFYQAISRKSVT